MGTKKKLTVAVVFGGRSVEHEVSIRSARAVATALMQAGYSVVALGIDPKGSWLDRDRSESALFGQMNRLEPSGEPVRSSLHHLLGAQIDVVFPVVHGTWGEDGTLQGLCEMVDLPYVGCDVASSAVAMDKLLCKRLLVAASIPVVDFLAVSRREFAAEPRAILRRASHLPPPIFVKPAVGGSSVGISRVEDPDQIDRAVREALELDENVLIERGIEGRELECAVIGAEEISVSALGEIVSGAAFYDYADKYLTDAAKLIAPVELSSVVERHIKSLAERAFAALGGIGMARVDFLVEGHTQAYVNEINTIPGFTQISMFPRLWALSGLPLPQLVERLVEIARWRHQRRREVDGAIGRWLAELAEARNGQQTG